MIDLRSDTVTKPSPPMLDAMMNAKVGDDVFEQDPTVNELEKYAADLFGMEASIFCPSGTMTNQIAVKLHTQPGDQIICDKLCHIYNYEGGGAAANAGVSVKLLEGDRGRFTLDQVLAAINPDDVHFPVSKLVSIENTSNKGGGCYWDVKKIENISHVCSEKDLGLHLDGARLFNALVETKTPPKKYGELFNTISICLSKGLGAPVGSLLLGTKENIKKARRVRKVFGGGMRQAGFIAAAGLYALQNNIERLIEDHQRATQLGSAIEGQSYVKEVLPVDTNIVIFTLNEGVSEAGFIDKLKLHNILAVAMGKQTIRFVTHLDFTDDMLEDVITALPKLF